MTLCVILPQKTRINRFCNYNLKLCNNNLLDKKKILDLRIKTFEKQEDKLKEKAKKLQQEVMNDMKEQGN